jgi:hypothetical protein
VSLITIPRTAVKVALQGLRLPITGIEAIAGQQGNDSWPPVIAFDGFEASAKQVVGSILRDETLVEEGRVQQAKVIELRRAIELDAEAEQTRAAADAALRARRDDAARQRRHAEAEAERREQAIEQDRVAQAERTAKQLNEKATTIERSDRARDNRVSALERNARRTRVDEEMAAVKQQSRAVQATKSAKDAAHAVEQKKARRKAT